MNLPNAPPLNPSQSSQSSSISSSRSYLSENNISLSLENRSLIRKNDKSKTAKDDVQALFVSISNAYFKYIFLNHFYTNILFQVFKCYKVLLEFKKIKTVLVV